MRNLKRLFCLICVICLTLGAVPVLAVSAGGDENAAVDNTAYEKLTAMGLIDPETTPLSDGAVTRGDFIRLVMEVSGDAAAADRGSAEVFADVTPETANADYINTAYKLGYISGEPNGNFYPDNPISCVEAIKMTLGVLGYRVVAEESGGFPSGYLRIANRMRLLDGITCEEESPLAFGDAMRLLLNTAEADLLEIVRIGYTIGLSSVNGENILSRRFNIRKIKAIVEANAHTDIMARESGLETDEISVGGITMLVGETNASDAVGLYAEIYYLDDKNGKPTILYINTDLKENYVIDLTYDSIDGCEGIKSVNYYDENRNLRKARLADNASLIYNGRLSDMTEEKLMPEFGTVQLISNNTDSLFEVVKVMDYQPIYVNGISALSNSISGRRTKTKKEIEQGSDESDTDIFSRYEDVNIELDPNASDYDVVILKDNTPVDFDSITGSQIISYAVSEGEKPLKTAVICDRVVNGEVTGVFDDHIIVNDAEYKAAYAITQTVQYGADTTYYLDFLNNVVYVGIEPQMVYGYLRAAEEYDFNNIFFRIFTQNDRWVTLEAANTVLYNGQNRISRKQLMTELAMNGENGYSQLIRYRVNSGGKIAAVDTAQQFAAGSLQEADAIERGVFRKTSSGTQSYRALPQSFDGDVSVAANAVLFSIPKVDERDNEEEYAVMSRSELVSDTSYTYTAYEGSAVRTASIFTLINGTRNSSNLNLMLINGVGQSLNSEGGISPSIFGYWNGTDFSLPVRLRSDSPIQDLSSLKDGDLISFSYDSLGYIDSVTLRYTEGQEYSVNSVYSLTTYLCGEVIKTDPADNRALLRYSSSGNTTVASFSSGKIYIYEKGRKRFTVGTLSDLSEGDRVYGRFRYLVCQEMFVIRD